MPGTNRYRSVQMWVLLLAWSLSACTVGGVLPAPLTATSVPTPVDYQAVLARLEPVATLEEAVGEIASSLDTPAEEALVRVDRASAVSPGTCVPCAGISMAVEEAVPVDQVALPLTPGSYIWITIRDVRSLYTYDGEQFHPVSVKVVPADD